MDGSGRVRAFPRAPSRGAAAAVGKCKGPHGSCRHAHACFTTPNTPPLHGPRTCRSPFRDPVCISATASHRATPRSRHTRAHTHTHTHTHTRVRGEAAVPVAGVVVADSMVLLADGRVSCLYLLRLLGALGVLDQPLIYRTHHADLEHPSRRLRPHRARQSLQSTTHTGD